MSNLFRSLVFVPGNNPRFLEKAKSLPADIVCFDLEDSVPDKEKKKARVLIKNTLKQRKKYSPDVFVRTNSPESGMVAADLKEIVQKGIDGIVIPNKIKYKGKIIVIGDLNQVPGYKEKLFDLAATLDVKFVDLIKDKLLLMTYIKKARLFVFPSSQEAMSMMLLEVATMKTPLICSDIPENKAVFDENSVLFFETDNADDLSDKLSYALKHPERMDEYTGQAFQVLKDKYQWKYLAEEYGKLYKKIIKT